MPSSLSAFERLFLLEFFVDYIYLLNSAFDNVESSLCICFQFLKYPVMRVCESDFTPNPQYLEEESKFIFKSGKSCLFSVVPDEDNKISSQFDLIIAVCQISRNKDPPWKSIIGKAVVNLGTSFVNLIQSPEPSFSSTSNVKHDSFPLQSKSGYFVGELAAFVRLSTFGKVVVTQFQLADTDKKEYLFKGTDEAKLFKEGGDQIDFPIIESGYKQPEPPPIAKPKVPSQSKPIRKTSVEEDESDDSDESDESETETSESTSRQSIDEKGDNEGIKDDGLDYNEIGAEINGHAITIRFVKKNKYSKNENQCNAPSACCCSPETPICPYAPKLNVCECDYPLPPELVTPRCPPQCCQQRPCCSPSIESHNLGSLPVSSKSIKENDETQPVLPICPREDCPLGLNNTNPPQDPLELEPGCVALKGDQVFFQMANRPAGEPVNEREKKHCASIFYTVGATENGEDLMKNVVQITPQSLAEPLTEGVTSNGPVSGHPVDSKLDMFLLKVQKQSDDVSTQCKLEMELRTPKEKEIKPDSKATETQYLVTDFPPVEKKKGKKGGKNEGKGKDGKGKKGKKK